MAELLDLGAIVLALREWGDGALLAERDFRCGIGAKSIEGVDRTAFFRWASACCSGRLCFGQMNFMREFLMRRTTQGMTRYVVKNAVFFGWSETFVRQRLDF